MRALVTGAGGFLGSALVRALRRRNIQVSTLQRGEYPWMEALRVRVHRGDLTDPVAVYRATEDCDVVFHVAALAGVWGAYKNYYRTNVTGTRHVLDACRLRGVGRLIYTSTPSVVFSGTDESGISEETPYPDKFLNAYARTKAKAEKEVLLANSSRFSTMALRPHLIWGPGDPHLVPRVLERGRRGRLRLVGKHDKLVDSTYIDNAVHAQLCALDRLEHGAPCAGKAYFISNGEPVAMAELLNRILASAELPPVSKRVPTQLAYALGLSMETVYRLLRVSREPLMTRFVARQLSCDHYYDLGAARRDLGYVPQVTLDEGFDNLRDSLK